MPIRTINNVVKYVPTEEQEPVPAATSTLQVNETQQLYPVMQGPTSTLEIKKSIIKQKLTAHVQQTLCVQYFTLQKRKLKGFNLTIESYTHTE